MLRCACTPACACPSAPSSSPCWTRVPPDSLGTRCSCQWPAHDQLSQAVQALKVTQPAFNGRITKSQDHEQGQWQCNCLCYEVHTYYCDWWQNHSRPAASWGALNSRSWSNAAAALVHMSLKGFYPLNAHQPSILSTTAVFIVWCCSL
jgi:hypothetical protein